MPTNGGISGGDHGLCGIISAASCMDDNLPVGACDGPYCCYVRPIWPAMSG